MNKQKNVLIITSSGGGGCLQLAEAKKQQVIKEDPKANVIIADVMKDWSWLKMGQLFVFIITLWSWKFCEKTVQYFCD